jgi:hypothetical protein
VSTYALVVMLVVLGTCVWALEGTWRPLERFRGLALVVLVFEPARRPFARRLLLLALVSTVGIGLWLTLAASHTWRYLGPHIDESLLAVPRFLEGDQAEERVSATIRGPTYEIWLAYLGVIALAVAFGVGFVKRFRDVPSERGRLIACALLGLVFFVSLPIVLVAADATTIARTWEFAFIGLAPVAAFGLFGLFARAGFARALLGSAALVLAFVTGATGRSGENIRFPGPYIATGGPRSTTADVIEAADWLRRNHGASQVVMGDITVAAVFGSYGGQLPASYQNFGYRPWQVFDSKRLTARGLYELDRSRTNFVVVDERVAESPPFGGYYFAPDEPIPSWRPPMPRAFLEKFDRDPRFDRVYDNGNVKIYRFLPNSSASQS